MSKITCLKCDFCGRDASQMVGEVHHHKIRREWRVYDTLFRVNLDICSDCLMELRSKVREKKMEE